MDKSIEKIALPVISALTKKKIFYFGIHLSPNQHGNNFEHRKHASITDHGLSRIYSSEFPTSIYLEIKVGTKNVSLSLFLSPFLCSFIPFRLLFRLQFEGNELFM